MRPNTAPAVEDILLRATGLEATFGAYRAVDNVSFDVRVGEVFGIAGPNGAGKSTLFNLLSGIPNGPSAGQVVFDGRPIHHISGHSISRLGLRRTFQADQVFPGLTMLENVAVASRYLGGRRGVRQRAEIALDRVGLSDQRRESAADLSTLAKKKLMIAGALIGDAKLLMLDEPAGGLDADDQHQLASLIRDLNADGLTIIVIEHVLSLLREVATRMMVLVAGQTLTLGPPADVLTDPRVVEAYLGAVNAA
jgi:branched-chain amino acid transport system ATP-binding protein